MRVLEVSQKTAERMLEWMKYESHEVYYIEDTQKVLGMPAGGLFRRKYVYDKTSRKALVKEFLKEDVEFVDDLAVFKKLDKIIQRRIQVLNRGIFVRQLHSDLPHHLRDLLAIMHGYSIPRGINPTTLEEETEEDYQKRKQEYLNKIFNLVISEG